MPTPATRFAWPRSYIVASISWWNEQMLVWKALVRYSGKRPCTFQVVCSSVQTGKRVTRRSFSGVFELIFLQEASSGSFFGVILATPRIYFTPIVFFSSYAQMGFLSCVLELFWVQKRDNALISLHWCLLLGYVLYNRIMLIGYPID